MMQRNLSKEKIYKIVYWISTVWLALGMVSTGIVQLLKVEKETDFIIRLGYPGYFLPILGVSKLLGVVAILIPRFPMLKEWAYAGFFFMMTGAIASHLAAENPISDILPPLLLLVLTVISWYFRPRSRKIILLNH